MPADWIEILKTGAVSFWSTAAQMSPYLLLGFAVAGVLRVLIPDRFVQSHLGGKGFWQVFKASLFGVPLPLCSCGVIPVSMSIRKQGAGRGSVISFLLSTPQTGVDSIFVTLSLMGPVFAIFRPVAALVTGIIGGGVVDVFGGAEKGLGKAQVENSEASVKGNRISRAFIHGFLVLPRDIAPAILIGLIIAAGISVGVPDNFFAEHIGSGLGSMLLMMIVGIPFYVCATASVPIAAAMIFKGLSPGAALVFLMTGPATNAAGFATIWAVLGKRTALCYLLTVVFCALAGGFIMNNFLPGAGEYIQRHYKQMSPGWFEHTSAVLLLVVLGWGIYKKYQKTCPDEPED